MKVLHRVFLSAAIAAAAMSSHAQTSTSYPIGVPLGSNYTYTCNVFSVSEPRCNFVPVENHGTFSIDGAPTADWIQFAGSLVSLNGGPGWATITGSSSSRTGTQGNATFHFRGADRYGKAYTGSVYWTFTLRTCGRDCYQQGLITGGTLTVTY